MSNLQPSNHLICPVDASTKGKIGDLVQAAIDAGTITIPLKSWRGFCVGGIIQPTSTADITLNDEYDNGPLTIASLDGPFEINSSSILDHYITCTATVVVRLYLLKAAP